MKMIIQVISLVEVEINEAAFAPGQIDAMASNVARDAVHGPDIVRMAFQKGTGNTKARVTHDFAIVVDRAEELPNDNLIAEW